MHSQKNPVLRTLEDVESHFGGHSLFGPMLVTLKAKPTVEAVRKMAHELKVFLSNADVSALETNAEQLANDAAYHNRMLRAFDNEDEQVKAEAACFARAREYVQSLVT